MSFLHLWPRWYGKILPDPAGFIFRGKQGEKSTSDQKLFATEEIRKALPQRSSARNPLGPSGTFISTARLTSAIEVENS